MSESNDHIIEGSRSEYTELSTVESQRNDLAPEEFPEGPYSSLFHAKPLGKSKPYRKDQRVSSAFDYENHKLHAVEERDYPGAQE